MGSLVRAQAGEQSRSEFSERLFPFMDLRILLPCMNLLRLIMGFLVRPAAAGGGVQPFGSSERLLNFIAY